MKSRKGKYFYFKIPENRLFKLLGVLDDLNDEENKKGRQLSFKIWSYIEDCLPEDLRKVRPMKYIYGGAKSLIITNDPDVTKETYQKRKKKYGKKEV